MNLPSNNRMVAKSHSFNHSNRTVKPNSERLTANRSIETTISILQTSLSEPTPRVTDRERCFLKMQA
jgi:hypothetical protein